MKIWMQRHGDVARIAEKTGVSRPTVYAVIKGESQHEQVKAAIIQLNDERIKTATKEFQQLKNFHETLANIAHEVLQQQTLG